MLVQESYPPGIQASCWLEQARDPRNDQPRCRRSCSRCAARRRRSSCARRSPAPTTAPGRRDERRAQAPATPSQGAFATRNSTCTSRATRASWPRSRPRRPRGDRHRHAERGGLEGLAQTKSTYWPGERLTRVHARAARLAGDRRRSETPASSWANSTAPTAAARRHRRAQPGAGRHTERPAPFALAQQPPEVSMMNSARLPSRRAVGAPARLDGDQTSYRAPRQRGALGPGPRLREVRGRLLEQQKLFSGYWSRITASTADAGAGRSARSGRPPASAPSTTAATSTARRSASATASSRPRHLPGEGAGRDLGGQVVEYDAARKCCGFPVGTDDEPRDLTAPQSGTHARRRDRRRPPAALVTPCPRGHLNRRHAAAGGGQGRQHRRPAPTSTCRSQSASPSPRPRRRIGDEQARRLAGRLGEDRRATVGAQPTR